VKIQAESTKMLFIKKLSISLQRLLRLYYYFLQFTFEKLFDIIFFFLAHVIISIHKYILLRTYSVFT